MPNIIRWNLTNRASRKFAEADSIVVSIPKSGRTWLRFVLQNYYSRAEGRTFALRNREFESKDLPRVVYTHDYYSHRLEESLRYRLLGKNLIPHNVRHSDKPIMLLARDPRDVIVSMFFQLTLREKSDGIYAKISMKELIRHSSIGIRGMVEIMNTWLSDWGNQNGFVMLRYEDCRAQPREQFRKALLFLGETKIDEGLLDQAIDFGQFENMQKIEAEGKFEVRMLKPGDVNKTDSFKVRRGKIGGYQDYLDESDIRYMNDVIAGLDRRFGY